MPAKAPPSNAPATAWATTPAPPLSIDVPALAAPAAPLALSARSATDPEPLPETAQRAPPYFAQLFEPGRVFYYATVDDVDPHSPEGRRVVTKLEIRCVVTDPVPFSGAVASSLGCSANERIDHDTPETVRQMAFISAPGGIWLTTSTPDTQEQLAALIREPPQLDEVPKPRTRSFQRGGPSPDDVEPCTARVEVASTSACYEERCKPKMGYGDTRSRTCFSRGRGLESFREENLMGPRTLTWKLIRVEPPPPDYGEE